MISYVKARKIDGDGSSGAFVMGLGLKVRREGEIDASESRGELRGECVYSFKVEVILALCPVILLC